MAESTFNCSTCPALSMSRHSTTGAAWSAASLVLPGEEQLARGIKRAGRLRIGELRGELAQFLTGLPDWRADACDGFRGLTPRDENWAFSSTPCMQSAAPSPKVIFALPESPSSLLCIHRFPIATLQVLFPQKKNAKSCAISKSLCRSETSAHNSGLTYAGPNFGAAFFFKFSRRRALS